MPLVSKIFIYFTTNKLQYFGDSPAIIAELKLSMNESRQRAEGNSQLSTVTVPVHKCLHNKFGSVVN